MDLPTELHIKIAKNIVLWPNNFYPPDHPAYTDVQVMGYVPEIRAFRTVSAYWTDIIDHVIEQEKKRWDKVDPGNRYLQVCFRRFCINVSKIRS